MNKERLEQTDTIKEIVAFLTLRQTNFKDSLEFNLKEIRDKLHCDELYITRNIAEISKLARNINFEEKCKNHLQSLL